MAKANNMRAAFIFHSPDRARLGKMTVEIAAAGMKVLIGRTGALNDIAATFEYQAAGRGHDKIILATS